MLPPVDDGPAELGDWGRTGGFLSAVSCIISAMPNEDMAEIPAEWRDVVHPRRHGMIAVKPARDSGEDVGRERLLDHPFTDSELAVLTPPGQ